MKLITRDTDYSIKALAYIAKNSGRPITITELVKELDSPKPFMRKILQMLSAGGILSSRKGKNGGFELAKNTGDILLTDIMEIFQGKFKLSECLFKKDICPNLANCILKSKIEDIEANVEKSLKDITLYSLINS
jgi:Rrf2 family protein